MDNKINYWMYATIGLILTFFVWGINQEMQTATTNAYQQGLLEGQLSWNKQVMDSMRNDKEFVYIAGNVNQTTNQTKLTPMKVPLEQLCKEG